MADILKGNLPYPLNINFTAIIPKVFETIFTNKYSHTIVF